MLSSDVEASLRELGQRQVGPLFVVRSQLRARDRLEQRCAVPGLNLLEGIPDLALGIGFLGGRVYHILCASVAT